MSNLLQQVYQLLGMKGIRTTSYHSTGQDGGKIQSDTKKHVSITGPDWDRWLPYLLFACQEGPQASTDSSPFELLYGHQVRGPLDLLKQY